MPPDLTTLTSCRRPLSSLARARSASLTPGSRGCCRCLRQFRKRHQPALVHRHPDVLCLQGGAQFISAPDPDLLVCSGDIPGCRTCGGADRRHCRHNAWRPQQPAKMRAHIFSRYMRRQGIFKTGGGSEENCRWLVLMSMTRLPGCRPGSCRGAGFGPTEKIRKYICQAIYWA